MKQQSHVYPTEDNLHMETRMTEEEEADKKNN